MPHCESLSRERSKCFGHKLGAAPNGGVRYRYSDLLVLRRSGVNHGAHWGSRRPSGFFNALAVVPVATAYVLTCKMYLQLRLLRGLGQLLDQRWSAILFLFVLSSIK